MSARGDIGVSSLPPTHTECLFCGRLYKRGGRLFYAKCPCGAHLLIDVPDPTEPLYPAHGRSPSPWEGRP